MPPDPQLISTLAQILHDVAGVDPAEVSPGQAFADDLDLDSLAMVEISVEVGDRFGLSIPDEEISQLVTVGDLADLIGRERAAT